MTKLKITHIQSEDEENDDFMSENDDSFGFDSEEEPPTKKTKKADEVPKAVIEKVKKSSAINKAPLKSKTPSKVVSSSSSSCSVASAGQCETFSSGDAIVPNEHVSSVDITRGPDITTEVSAKKLVLAYMKLQNRPYSLIQIHENLHRRIQKPTLERCLNSLSDAGGGLCCKEYGKAKIYFIDQSTMCSNFTAAQINEIELNVKNLMAQMTSLRDRERGLSHQLSALNDEPIDDDIDSILAETSKRVGTKRARANAASSQVVAKVDVEKLKKDYNSTRALWRDRKAKCMEVVEMLAEGLEKDVKHTTGILGLETDDDVGVKLPEVIKMK